MFGIDWAFLGAAALMSWAVNFALTPEPEPERRVCYYIKPYGDGELSTPVWCDEYDKKLTNPARG